MNPVTLIMINIVLEMHNKDSWITLAAFCSGIKKKKKEQKRWHLKVSLIQLHTHTKTS